MQTSFLKVYKTKSLVSVLNTLSNDLGIKVLIIEGYLTICADCAPSGPSETCLKISATNILWWCGFKCFMIKDFAGRVSFAYQILQTLTGCPNPSNSHRLSKCGSTFWIYLCLIEPPSYTLTHPYTFFINPC